MQIRVAVLAAAVALPSLSCPTPKPPPPPEPTATLTPTPTPEPTPAPLARVLVPYNVDTARFGRFEDTVRIQTAARVDRFGAITDAEDPQETPEVLAARMGEVLARVPRGMPIVLGLDYGWSSAGATGGDADVALIVREVVRQSRWSDVRRIEIEDEPEGGAAVVEAHCQSVAAVIAAQGLAPRPLSVTFTESSILQDAPGLMARTARGLRADEQAEATTADYVRGPGLLVDRIPRGMMRRSALAAPRVPAAIPLALEADPRGWMAPSLGVIALELYAPLQLAWSSDEVVSGWPLVSLERQIRTVLAARPGMRFAVIPQMYARSLDGKDRLGWRNGHTLALLVQQSFVAAEGQPDVIDVAPFSAGTRISCLHDSTHPEVHATLWPVLAAAASRMAGATVRWPDLPPNPIPSAPYRMEPSRIDIKGQNSDSPGVPAPRRWGIVIVNGLRVWDAQGREYDDTVQFLGRNVVQWTTSAGRLSAGHYAETQGWSGAVELEGVPEGSSVTITATLTAKGKTVVWSRSFGPITSAGYLAYGRCDIGGERRVPVWINDATGQARCSRHGGAW